MNQAKMLKKKKNMLPIRNEFIYEFSINQKIIDSFRKKLTKNKNKSNRFKFERNKIFY